MNKVCKIMAAALAVALLVLAAGCGGNPSSSDRGKALVVNLAGGDCGYPTPYSHYARGPGMFKMQLIFDSLLERGEKDYIPWLAEKWDVSADGKVYTFFLRENVKWQDGKPMTAEDVKFSFEYFILHPPLGDELTLNGKSVIEKVEVLNDHTVKITVDQPNAALLGRLGQARMIPKHIWEKVQDPQNFNGPEAVIGCGPYVLKEYNKELGAYKFEAFKEYWGPKPRVDVLQFVPVSDNILAFDKGEIDLTVISPDLLSKYQDNEEFKIQKNPPFWGYCLTFNLERRPEFQDKNMRQAFAYAVDRQELVEKVARGAAVPASAGYLPTGHIWYNPGVRQYEFNIAKAQELLKGRTPEFTLLISNSNDEVRIAELLKISCARAGIGLKIRSVDGKTRDAAAKKGEYEILLNGYGGWGGDADLLRSVYAAGANADSAFLGRGIPGYSNTQINDLGAQQIITMDREKRKALIFQLQEIIAEEVPRLPLYNTTGYIVYRPAKYDGWRYMFDHHEVTHNKLSYLADQ
ncbi:MAG: ABC transporter substrate-binding protein [Veillonellales bacterium]